MRNLVEDYFVGRESQQEKSSQRQRERPEEQWEEEIVKMGVVFRYLTE